MTPLIPPPIQAEVRDFLGRISRLRPSSVCFVIACSKAKASYRQPARNLYRSGRFQVQRRIGEAMSSRVLVLSAKHGLIDLDSVIAPYDVTYPDGIFADGAAIPNLDRLIGSKKQTVVFFGGNRYLGVLRRSLADTGVSIIAPFEHLNSYSSALWCRIAEDATLRRASGSEFYELIARSSRRFGLHPFSDFGSLEDIPERGVYFFFDPRERTSYSREVPRIVRVGTHAVSAGSKSTLRTRLRAHYGQRDATGNHRASIFRLHIGNAILASRGNQTEFPDWGRGMSADAATRASERPLEIEVSQYLSGLLFSFVELPDASSTTSQRSQLERASINFLGADYIPLEEPSRHWLGLSARSPAIRATGIWNIQHNGERFYRKDIDLIAKTLLNPRMAGT